MLAKENPEVIIAIDKLERISIDTEFQHQALVREKTIRDHYSSLSTAKEEGLIEGEAIGLEKGQQKRNIEIAVKMLDKNMPLEVISEITGLSESEINEIKSKI